MLRYWSVCGLVCLIGCGGGGAHPDPTTTSVTVTLQSPLRMGQTGQATATATSSDGKSQALTSGWLSDAPTVASVTSSGTVKGVANGRATIYIVSDGRQGQQLLRVTPDYHGGWEGGLRVTSCDESGAWAEADSCDGQVGTVYGYTLSLDQSGESMNARATYGDDFDFPGVNAAIASDGTSSFTVSNQLTQDNVTVTVEATFHLNSTAVGELSGTVEEVWRLPNVPGELRLAQNLVQTSRTSINPLGESAGRPSSKMHVLRRLRR